MAPSTKRQYDLVHLGATGYTGAYTVTHICTTLPSNLRWAVAGRSQAKMDAVVEDLKKRFPDRTPPAVEICQQNESELGILAAKTRIIISTIGPYSRFGEPVVKACAENGTGYLDATGEVPWVKLMADKYHETAKRTGAIIIPQAALESSFSDLFAYAMVSHVRKNFGTETKSMTTLLWDITGAPSGGTLETVFSLFDMFSPKQLLTAMTPYSLSPTPRPRGTYPARGGLGRFTGMMQVPKLGLAVNSGPIMGITNAAIVWRTWGLFQQAAGADSTPNRKTRSATKDFAYGSEFHYTEVRKAQNRLFGLLYHLAVSTFPLVLMFSPMRWLLRKLVYQPGQGPTLEGTKNDKIEMRAVAIPHDADGKLPPVTGQAVWRASMYEITGAFLANGAKVMLQIYKEKDGEAEAGTDECLARRLGGGVLTPACLGEAFLEGSRSSGFEVKIEES